MPEQLYALVLNNETEIATRPSILGMATDERYLTREWERAQQAFLLHVLTRKGMSAEEQRHNTASSYRVAITQFFDGVYDASGQAIWPIINPWQVTANLVRQWKQVMSLAGKAVTKNRQEVGRAGLSSASINLKLAGLKVFYDFVAYQYELPYQPAQHDTLLAAEVLWFTEDKRNVTLWPASWRNPFDAKSIARPTVQAFARSVYPSTDEVGRILNEINTTTLGGQRDYALLLMLFSTACRASEVLNLKWGDLVEQTNGNYVFSFRGKSGLVEQVELNRRVYQVLCQYLKSAERLEDIAAEDYIFTPLYPERAKRLNPDCDIERTALTPISNSQANKILKKYAKRAGVDVSKAHLHGLRHARARQTVEAMKAKSGQVDIVTINRMLRHANLDTTRIYTESMEAPEDKWSDDAIDAVLPKGDKRRKRKQPPAEQPPLL